MTFVGAVVAVILSAAAALVVGAGLTGVSGGYRSLGALGVLALCLVLPGVLDARVTRAFRKLEPDARGTHFETLAWVNGAWLALLLVVFPVFSRAALETHGAWWVVRSADRASIQAFVSKVAAVIPRSAAPAALALPEQEPTAANVGRPLARAPENAADDETPAARVYRERAASVVVIRTREVVKAASPLAALFSGSGAEVQEGLGSGFIVENEGVIVTNHHVVGAATALDVALQDGRHFKEASVLRMDPRNDLALISIPAKGLPVVPLSTRDVRIGARAIAIGSPLGLEYTLTEGIVSALRDIEETQFIQMQTSIAPGSSGGPLFDDRGELIGVNTLTQGANLNMAVHVSHVQALLSLPRDPRKLEAF